MQLAGSFAFLLYDRPHGRVVAARSADGQEPLAWGATMLSEGLLFASSRHMIDAECADAEDFPPGALFVSEPFNTAGQLLRSASAAMLRLAQPCAVRQALESCPVRQRCPIPPAHSPPWCRLAGGEAGKSKPAAELLWHERSSSVEAKW